ncbi:GABA-specific permease [Fusarium oxysporum f. sp. cubense]|uniref:GABA-specific permease n=1 Tax=Fusarium oxysporum f. sp. cubense TaxID=61366 RepID=A0A559KX46_FUSOC|nr:GABA-specific permease [Fusarium oxysporum f. sp. cubense]
MAHHSATRDGVAETQGISGRSYEESIGSTTIRTAGGDTIENGTISAFGYAPAYRRVLGALVGVAIVMALSSGWIIPNLMMLPQAIAIAELCSSMPVNGGFYWWSAALAPGRFSRPVAFIVGWFNVLSLATGLAAFAYAIAAGLAETITIATEYEFSNAELMGISMGVITLWASLMLLRLENVSIVMIITATFLGLSCIGFIIALPVRHSMLDIPFASAEDVFGSFKNYSSNWPETGIAVPFSFYGALFVNSIWAAPAYVAEETHDARREAPKAIMESFGCTAILGLGICLTFAFCIPDMDAVIADKTGYPFFVIVYNHCGGPGTVALLLLGSVFSTIGGSGMLLTYATQVAAFARDGGLPYSSYLSRIHQRTNMPLMATGLLLCLSYLFLLLSLSSHASDIVYSLATLASLIIWATPITFRLFARDRWVPGPFYTGRFSWTIHLLGVLTSAYFLITRAFPPTKDELPLTIIVVLGVLVASVLAYMFGSDDFKGLDLVALESWRHNNRHCIEGTVDFADIVRQSTVDQMINK